MVLQYVSMKAKQVTVSLDNMNVTWECVAVAVWKQTCVLMIQYKYFIFKYHSPHQHAIDTLLLCSMFVGVFG